MEVLGIGAGDEVLVPAMTFVASANAVEHAGATPVLVDSEPGTGLIDLDAAEAAITARTKAIMPVHLAGRPVDMDRLADLRDRHGLHVIEDAAHAIGAEWRGRRIGSFGNIAAFSFYVTKNITTIEGGAMVTDSEQIAEEVERLALHGLSLGAWQRFSDAGFRHYEVVRPGYKYNMTDVQAALGLRQLPQLDRVDRPPRGAVGSLRRRCWRACRSARRRRRSPTPATRAISTRCCSTPTLRWTATSCSAALNERKIGTGVHYRGVHLHPYYRDRYHLAPERLPGRHRDLGPHAQPASQPQGLRRRPGRRGAGAAGAAVAMTTSELSGAGAV